MMQLTPYQTLQLQERIQLKFDRRIRNQTDCIALSRLIQQEHEKKVGSHTLRRFFGIVQWEGEFRIKTMDILAIFVGFSSIDAFIKELNSEAELSGFIETTSVNYSDIYLYEKLIQNSLTIESAMVVGANIIRALDERDFERVLNLLDTLSPLVRKPRKYQIISSLIGQFLGPKFYEITDPKKVKTLVNNTIYVKLIMENFVPVMELGNGFGQHLRAMLAVSEDAEEQAYGNSLLASHAWRNGEITEAKNLADRAIKSSQGLRNIYPILKGRIDFLALLNGKGLNEPIHAGDFSPPKNQTILYYKTIANELVLLEQKNRCLELYESITINTDEANNWLEKSIMTMHTMAKLYGNASRKSNAQIRQELDLIKNKTWPKDHEQIALAMIKIIEKDLV